MSMIVVECTLIRFYTRFQLHTTPAQAWGNIAWTQVLLGVWRERCQPVCCSNKTWGHHSYDWQGKDVIFEEKVFHVKNIRT